jgi:methyl-accepting chemotaxis protein
MKRSKKMNMTKFKLSTKIMLQTVIVVICFALVLIWTFSRFKSKVTDDKVVSTRHVVEVAYGVIAHHQTLVQKGELELGQAQQKALKELENLRYEGKEYFWVNDFHPKMIMHPYQPELNGKDLTNNKDPNGKRIFVEFVNVCKEKGEGLVDYMWPKHEGSKPVRKISYVKLFEPWGWIVGSGIYIDDLENEIAQLMYIMFGIVGLIIVGSLFGGFIVSRNIAKPIYRTVQGLTEGSDQVASASSQVSAASQSLAEGSSEQASAIEETSASMEELSAMTSQNAENANQANNLMNETSRVVNEANESMQKLTTAMKEITTGSEDMAKIIKTIDEIAFQTNLLALNAAVEAARAGEAGAGFAVVADEVRNLAMRSAESAKNTANLIDDSIKRIKNGSDIVAKTNEAFDRVLGGAKKVGELVGEIAAASNEQSQGITQIGKAISEMDKVVQQNAANAEQSASASEELNAQAMQMKDIVSEMIAVVRGGEATVSGAKSLEAGPRRRPSPSAERADASKSLAVRDKHHKIAAVGAKIVKPDEIIPMHDHDEFKDF